MIISLRSIGKDYIVYKKLRGFARERKTVHALSDVSFDISQGEIVGYIGQNGAGKSTTIKIMSGILTPSAGECTVLGRVPYKKRREHVKHIGVVFGQRSSLWWDVPIIDSFDLLADIFGVGKADYKRTLDELSESLDIGSLLSTPARQLSLGQRMRCEIAASLLHSPEILFLDEPTIGLDAVSKIAVRQFITKINRERGVTVILTTHDMNDIEALASRVMLLEGGRLRYDGTLDEIRKKYAGDKIMTAHFASGDSITDIPGVHFEEISSQRAVLRFDASLIPADKVIKSLSDQVHLTDISVSDPPIENIVANMYKSMGGERDA